MSEQTPKIDCSEAELLRLVESIPVKANFTTKLDIASKLFLGAHYKANTLIGSATQIEEFTVSIKYFDCVTYVETCFALALSNSLNEFYKNLKEIRYKSGDISWKSRNHYMSSWIESNQTSGLCTVISPSFPATKINRKLSVITDYPQLNTNLEFIPTSKIIDGSSSPADGQLILFGTSREDLDVSHCGFVFNLGNKPHLRHASQKIQTVIEEPLDDFLFRFGASPGVILCELHPNKT